MRSERLSRGGPVRARTTMRAFALLALLLVPFAAAVVPLPATPTIVALPGAWLTQYATPAMVMQPGGGVNVLNLDIMYHDVVSVAVGSDAPFWCTNYQVGHCPLFWSRLANLAESVPVLGLENAAPGGTYAFYCSKHSGMTGTLVVLPA